MTPTTTLIAAGSWFIAALLIGTLIGKFIKAGKARKEQGWRKLTTQALDKLTSSGAPFFGGLWVNNARTGAKHFEVTAIYLSERETDEGACYFVPQVLGTDDETGWDLGDYEYFIPLELPTPPQGESHE